MSKSNQPHLIIGQYHRKLSELAKILSQLNATTSWTGFNRSRDLLEQLTKEVEGIAKEIQKEQ